jgi:hypothetical protein
VVTEHGPVSVSWEKPGNGTIVNFEISIPEGIKAIVHLPVHDAKATARMNGKIVVKDGRPAKGINLTGRWIVLQNVNGRCNGSIE